MPGTEQALAYVKNAYTRSLAIVIFSFSTIVFALIYQGRKKWSPLDHFYHNYGTEMIQGAYHKGGESTLAGSYRNKISTCCTDSRKRLHAMYGLYLLPSALFVQYAQEQRSWHPSLGR